MATNKAILQPVNVQGWLLGFSNIFHKENSEWWGTRTWLRRGIIWLLLINGILFSTLKTPLASNTSEPMPPHYGVTVFVIVDGLMAGLFTVITLQGAILDEKKSGTAAWVLSKPVTRTAFILAKLAANSLAAMVMMIVLQGVVAFVQFSLFDPSSLAVLPFLAGMGLLALHLLFYLTLTLMLGTFFNGRSSVIGIPFALLFGSQLVANLSPALTQIMPWSIILPNADGTMALAQLVMLGQPLPTVIPIIATVLWIGVFVSAAIWRFRHEEF